MAQEIQFLACEHNADGRYRDAEVLYRRAISNESISLKALGPFEDEHFLLDLISVYEKMDDCSAAEMAQETLLKVFFPKYPGHTTGEQNRAVIAYSKMLSDFRNRILDISPRLQIPVQTYIDLFIVYRIAILDIPSLNEVSLERGLFTLEPNEDHQCTLLHIAAKENATNLARLLIEKGIRINSRDPGSLTPLHIAAQYAESGMIELLLDSGADIEAVDGSDQTPLHRALIGYSDQQKLELLINAKVQMEARDNLGRTALMVAIQDDLPAVARFLVQRGANVEKSYGLAETPLLLAIRYKTEWAVKLFIENGASLVARNAQGETALYLATMMAQESTVQILLDHGAITKTTVDQQSAAYNTCLCRAVKDANITIVTFLLHAGADISAQNYLGDTALYQAVRGGTDSHEHVAHLLLTHSALLDTSNSLGHTVFHLAVLYCRLNMISILIQYAKPAELATICETRDDEGHRPLDLALRSARGSWDARLILETLESALGITHSSI